MQLQREPAGREGAVEGVGLAVELDGEDRGDGVVGRADPLDGDADRSAVREHCAENTA